jgi:hypothetical protein
MKIRPVGADSFYAEGRTDMTKLIVAFRNFAQAPESKHCVPEGTLLRRKAKPSEDENR